MFAKRPREETTAGPEPMKDDRSQPMPEQPEDGPGSPGAGEYDPEAYDALAQRVEALERERDELDAKWRRTLADFTNYQKRSFQNEAEARERGVAAVVESVIVAMDHFEKALSHDASKMTAEQLVDGVKMIHAELVKAVSRHGAGLIEPRANDEFDPMRHQAVARRAAEGVEPGRIVEALQTGYSLGGRTIRPAMVVVSPTE